MHCGVGPDGYAFALLTPPGELATLVVLTAMEDCVGLSPSQNDFDKAYAKIKGQEGPVDETL